jgi:Protein of unknown function (DUF2491)
LDIGELTLGSRAKRDLFVRAPRSRRLAPWLALLLTIFACVTLPASSFARRSSGGYSLPSAPSRTPSFGSGLGGGYRTPSTSGGYSRPSPSYAPPPARTAPQSPGDRSFSQGQSSAALDAYRTQQDNARRQGLGVPGLPSQPGGSQGQYSPRYDAPRARDRAGWFSGQGWSAPTTTYSPNRSFGVWDGLFLGYLLSNLGRPGASDFFHNNQNDPGYQQWRSEADRQAQDNAALRQKLDELDRQLADRENRPRTPGALPPGVPSEIAKASPSRTPGMPAEGSGSKWVWVVLLGGVGAVAYLAWQRSGRISGPASTSMQPANALERSATLLRHKLSGEPYIPSKFRIGMTLALDPTPFILAGNAIKLQPSEGSGQISVSTVGHVVSGDVKLVRLYLPDGRTFVQLHLDAAGDPDECRMFGTIDDITPADPSEWAAWLDPNEGMIGWPVFQTKDGKTYARVWLPGNTRVPPRALTETIESLSGTRTVESQAMLYAAPTGAPAPAPATEYILVAAVQDSGRAWVEIRAGIDLNPITLQLA